MDEGIVFEKTERGQREIAQPGGELHSKERRLLIMIDGAKSIGDLVPLTRPGEIEVILESLLRGGFIVAAGGEGGAQSAEEEVEEAAPAPVAVAGATSFEAIRKIAMREVQDLLGPHGDSLAIEIERCKSMGELRVLLAKAHEIISKAVGTAKAEAFRDKTR